MELENAETVDELLADGTGATDAPTVPCADCMRWRNTGLAIGVMVGISLGICLGAFLSRNG